MLEKLKSIFKKKDKLDNTYPEADEYRLYVKYKLSKSSRAAWHEIKGARRVNYIAPQDIEELDVLSGFEIKLDAYKDGRKLGTCRDYPFLVPGSPDPEVLELLGIKKRNNDDDLCEIIKKQSNELKAKVDDLLETRDTLNSALNRAFGSNPRDNYVPKGIFDAYNVGMGMAIYKGLQKQDEEVAKSAINLMHGISNLVSYTPQIALGIIEIVKMRSPNYRPPEEQKTRSPREDTSKNIDDLLNKVKVVPDNNKEVKILSKEDDEIKNKNTLIEAEDEQA